MELQARKPTITTVAERAGVAVSTVSRVLNGGYVSDAARGRVRQVIDELGYVPSATARNLSLGRQGSIGVVVESSQDLWFMQLLAGIEEELSERHLSLMLASLALRGRYDATTVAAWIRERRVDGLVFARSLRRERPLLQAAAGAKLPFVAIGPDEPVTHGHVVRCDNLGAGTLVADHLVQLGHTRIAFAGGPRDSRDTSDRLRGLRDGLLAHRIRIRTEWVSFCRSYAPQAGEEYALRFLRRRPDVTAVVLGNDALALGFMRELQRRGLAIPRDLSVVGFDSVPEGARMSPALTTVAQPMREMGRTACRKLLAEIDSPGDERPSTIEYRMELLVRESTGAAPLPQPRGSARSATADRHARAGKPARGGRDRGTTLVAARGGW
jgi:LacI family transcriptional regulator